MPASLLWSVSLPVMSELLLPVRKIPDLVWFFTGCPEYVT